MYSGVVVKGINPRAARAKQFAARQSAPVENLLSTTAKHRVTDRANKLKTVYQEGEWLGINAGMKKAPKEGAKSRVCAVVFSMSRTARHI